MSDPTIEKRIERIKASIAHEEYDRGCALALALLHDTVGIGHPTVRYIELAQQSQNWMQQKGALEAVVALYEDGVLASPALRIAHEIEGGFLDVAEEQVKAAARFADHGQKALALGIAAFLAGAVLEDALRRLADANALTYDVGNTSLAKLQALLYQPANGIEVIDRQDVKNITSWGGTRNNADHGHLHLLTEADVLALVIGVRGFLDKHLP